MMGSEGIILLRKILGRLPQSEFSSYDKPLDFIVEALDVQLSTRASEATLQSVLSQLDVPLSNLASEATLSAIKNALASIGADKRLVTPDNPPNLDVAISTRASESTLLALNNKFPPVTALSDSMANPTTTLIGSALLGYDDASGVWRRLRVTADGKLQLYLG